MKLFSKNAKNSRYYRKFSAILQHWRSATLMAALLLSGCMGIYEGGFECPAGTGVGCKSISDVNAMVNQGELPKAPAEQMITTKAEIWYAPGSRVQCSVSSVQKGHSWQTPSNSAKTCPCTMERRKGALSFDEKSI